MQQTAERTTTKAQAPGSAGGAEKMGLIQWAATRFGEVDPGKVMGILRNTCFKTGPNDEAATDAEVAALLIVARNYDLNPFTKEIFAFKDKYKGIVPIVSIDGWASLVNRHEKMDGVEFEVGPETTAKDGGKKAFEWVKCRMFVKGRSKPVEVTEYLDEVYQEPRGQNRVFGPWQTHPKRMHRHKAYIQCARLAFGFGGIFDEDEGERIIGTGAAEPILAVPGSTMPVEPAKEGVVESAAQQPPRSKLAEDLRKRAGGAEDATVVDEDVTQQIQGVGNAAEPEAEEKTPAGAEGPSGQPSIESCRSAIARASAQEHMQGILQDMLKLSPGDDRNALMVEWNAKVVTLAGGAPPAGFDGKEGGKPAARQQAKRKDSKPYGKVEDCDQLIDKMEKAGNMDKLNEVSDLARAYLWTPGQQQLLNDKYAECAALLQK